MPRTDFPSVRKSDVIERLAATMATDNLTPEDAGLVVTTILDTMREALISGDRIEIRGFGTFTVNDYPARTGRHPRDPNKVIQVPAKRLPRFRCGKSLRESVMGSVGQ
jgi:integration host factor subunit beta